MSKASRLVLAIFGCFLFFVVIWNVEYGLWNDEETSVSQKVDLIGLATFSCTESNIYDQIENSGYSSCLYPLGSYALPDVLLGGLGLILAYTGLSSALNLRFNSKGQSKRKSWGMMIGGAILAVFGALDIFGISNPGGSSLEWESIIGIPSLIVNLFLIIIGIVLFRRGSTNHTQILNRSSSTRISYRGKMELDGTDMSVGQMRRMLGLDILEDVFQLGSSDEFEEKVGRVCHYCSGAGCSECDSTGSI